MVFIRSWGVMHFSNGVGVNSTLDPMAKVSKMVDTLGLPVLGGGWFLLTSKSGREHIAERALLEKGYRAYLPLFQNEPLFPGYLFAQIAADAMAEINRSPNMSLAKIPGPIPESLIDQFKAASWQRSEECAEGAKVRITDGPFNHWEAIVKAKSAERITVFLTLLGNQSINLKHNQVEPA